MGMTTPRLGYTLLLLVLVTVAPAADDVLATLAARLAQIRTASGSFLQQTRRSDDPSALPSRLDGRFAVRVPDAYDLVYSKATDPEWRQRFVSDGVTSWEIEVTDSDLEPDTKQAPAGVRDAHLRRVLAAMRGDLATLGKDFRLTATAEGDGWRLDLAPLTTELAEEVTHIAIVLDHQVRPVQVVLDERSATVTVNVLAVEYDGSLPAGLFTR